MTSATRFTKQLHITPGRIRVFLRLRAVPRGEWVRLEQLVDDEVDPSTASRTLRQLLKEGVCEKQALFPAHVWRLATTDAATVAASRWIEAAEGLGFAAPAEVQHTDELSAVPPRGLPTAVVARDRAWRGAMASQHAEAVSAQVLRDRLIRAAITQVECGLELLRQLLPPETTEGA